MSQTSEFNMFEQLDISHSERKISLSEKESSLNKSLIDVRRIFGSYLKNSTDNNDYSERFSYLNDKISDLISVNVSPTPEVLSWLKEELNPIKSTKSSSLVKKGDVSEWSWDSESRSFKSTKTSKFKCVCGSHVDGIGQHTCACGKIWNISSLIDSNKTASSPLFICREVIRRDTVLASTKQKKKSTVVDPQNPSKKEVPSSEGYDVPKLLEPAAGVEIHDETWKKKMKSSHNSTLNLIFSDFPVENPPAPPMPSPKVAPDPLVMAQDSILDLILQEKREEVMGGGDTEHTQDLLEDAYKSLDAVQGIQNSNPIMAAYREGYVSGYLDRLSENSYEDRKTDYVGTKPAIPGISNGTDDIVPNSTGTDTTQDLRNELANQFDHDNGVKELRSLDPAQPFGSNKTTS